MVRRGLALLMLVAATAAAGVTTAHSASATTPTYQVVSAPTAAVCPTGRAGFGSSFWNPYDNWTASQVSQDIRSQQQVRDNTIIVDWSVDQEANAAWYPNTLGYNYFENTIPTLVSTAKATGERLWMGLIVSPTLFQVDGNDWSFMQAEVPKFERLADDLYRQYGASISGWYIPTEPNQTNVATYSLSYQYGAWLRQIDDYLHTHDGAKKIMIAPEMPSAANSGLTPLQFVQEMQPMMAIANIDVWNFEDGFGMTGWTPQQEANGFVLARQYGSQYHGSIWADVYTPSTSAPSQWEPYLQAIAATGTSNLSQWTFPEYMDPTATSGSGSGSASASPYYSSYYGYCVG